MSENFVDETSELGDDFFKSYAKKVKEETQSKPAGGSYEKPEYEDVAYVGCEKGIFTIVRLLGAPIGAESQGYKRRPTDPKEIVMCEVKDDEGKRFTIKLPLRAEIARDNHILYRMYDKVCERVKIGDEKVFKNKSKHPEVFEMMTKGGFKPEDGKTYQYSSGYKGDRLSIYNCIDRGDTWCKDNKHSKILCRDLNIDDQNRVWAKPGIKSFGSVAKIADLLGKYGSFEKFDIGLQKTGLKDNPWNVENASRCKEVQMLEKLANADGTDTNEAKIAMPGPLTDEERAYGRYDIDKIFAPTSYYKIYKRVPSLFKMVDAAFGTTFEDEVKDLIEEEKKGWEAKKAEREATQSAAENAEIQKNLDMPSPDETNPSLSDDAIYGSGASFDNMEKVEETQAPSRRRASSSSVPPYVALLKGYDTLSPEIKARIVDVAEVDGKIKITWDRSDDLLECDSCDAMSPEEGVTHCPACGVKF